MGDGRVRNWLLALGAGCLVAAVFHLAFGGSLPLSFGEIFSVVMRGPGGSGTEDVVVWNLRLPRAMACLATGGILGVVGSCFRTFFRNPLAEPYVLGVASGAAAGGTLIVLMGLDAVMGGGLMLMAGAVGGLLTLLLVWTLGGAWRGKFDVVRLLLAGVVIGSMLSAVVTLMLLMAGRDTNQVLRWLLGSMTPMYWTKVGVLWGALALGSLVLYRQTRRLNAVAFEGDGAGRLGVDVKKLSTVVLGLGTVMVGIVVGSVGIIGFVGLVAPHMARGLVGADLRRVYPLAGLLGAILVTSGGLGGSEVGVGPRASRGGGDGDFGGSGFVGDCEGESGAVGLTLTIQRTSSLLPYRCCLLCRAFSAKLKVIV